MLNWFNPIFHVSLLQLSLVRLLLALPTVLDNTCGLEPTLPMFKRFVAYTNGCRICINWLNRLQHTTSNDEVVTGEEQVHEFKTETKRLLDIVANSLYSEKEIFVR